MPLPPGVDVAAYRLVQESFSNVRKHARARSATVTLNYEPSCLTIEVGDDGVGARRRRRRGRARPHRHARTSVALRRPARVRPRTGEGVAGMGAATAIGMIRLLIADDQALVRSGFAMILNAQPDFEVVGEAADGHQALDLARRLRPDLVLMDVRMPRLDGIAATRELFATAVGAAPKVVMLTTFDLDAYVYEALRAGASGFLLKDVSPDELVRAVHTVLGGEALLAPTIMRRMIDDFLTRPPAASERPTRLQELTDRETEVLIALARGLSNAEIADELHLSAATIKTHVARVLTKLDVRDRIHAAITAYETGLVRPGDAGRTT